MDSNLKEEINNLTSKVKQQVIEWRRHLHQHPELSFQETNTSKFIYDTLLSFKELEVYRPTKTSVIARLHGSSSGKTLAIRADIDALPILEETKHDYVSKSPGIMHACGHDGHTAILLGTAKILSLLKNHIKGEIRFIFQHGEEQLPGGAKEIIATKALENVDFIIGAHLWVPIDQGKVFTKTGPLMASADVFKIVIQGQGGHSAEPHFTTDALSIGTQVVNNIQHIISRNIDPFENAVVSVTKFTAGTSHSIIPDTAELVGSVRSFNQKVRNTVPEKMENIVKGVTSAHGATYKFHYQMGYDPVINDNEPTQIVKEAIQDILGDETLIEQKPMMISEDFSAYQKEAPSCFFLIGAGNKDKGIVYPHHHPKFDIDEESLDIGVKVFTQSAIHFLNN